MKQGVLVNHRVRLLFKKAWCTLVRYISNLISSLWRFWQLMFSCTCRAWAATVSAERAAASASLFEATQHGTVAPPGCRSLAISDILEKHVWPSTCFWPLRFKVWFAFGQFFQSRLHCRPWPCRDPLGCLADNVSVKRASAISVIADCLRLDMLRESLICVA